MGDVLKIVPGVSGREVYRAIGLEAVYQTVTQWHHDWSRHRFFHWLSRAILAHRRGDLMGHNEQRQRYRPSL